MRRYQLALTPSRARGGERAARRRPFAASLYERLAPYAGRPVTAGRVLQLRSGRPFAGRLGRLLGRKRDAVRHLEDAIRLNERSVRGLADARGTGPGTELVASGPAHQLN